MRRLFVFATFAALTGCASTTNVTPMGDGKFTVGSKVHGGMTSWNEVKAMAVNKGAAFCKEQGKEISDVQIETHGVRSLTPQEAEVTFQCK
ncbi:hypothetical protein [Achromobacter marplatensis]|uniref:hypothetical protein n=1 Tax=Achromobacter marplatensis TaxID=470868 RepID=UPI0028E3B9FF|nr:hypothetical protein [Achromobacter marplatensis]